MHAQSPEFFCPLDFSRAMKTSGNESPGRLISRMLAGSWRRSDLPSFDINESELDKVVPLLYGSGAAALGWWRVRNTELRTTGGAELLQQAYRLQVLQSGVHEEDIYKVVRLLNEASIESVLIKGWAAAGLYPERGLRAYGDIDLFIRPEQHMLAVELLSNDAGDCWVDLHENISELDDRPQESLFARSTTQPLRGEEVRVLCAEDHFALLAVHLLKHGAWRPLWLCDIGAALESLPADFDWDRCLGSNHTRAGWIKAAIKLAHKFLDARVDRVPAGALNYPLPAWLEHNVLRQWERPFASEQPPMSHPVPMSLALRNPSRLWEALRGRWPDPVLATVSMNGEFNRIPRLPYQLGNCLARSFRFLFHSP